MFRNIDYVKGESYTVNYNIIAQYPFYIDYNNDCDVTPCSDTGGKTPLTAQTSVRRKASGIADGTRAVVMSPMSMPTTTTVESTYLSGIIDTEMFGGDGEVELYNLQGIRVVGDPAPGIYLRRCGNSVTKVIVK